jgi:hypothetical protein
MRERVLAYDRGVERSSFAADESLVALLRTR